MAKDSRTALSPLVEEDSVPVEDVPAEADVAGTSEAPVETEDTQVKVSLDPDFKPNGPDSPTPDKVNVSTAGFGDIELTSSPTEIDLAHAEALRDSPAVKVH